MLAVPLKQDKQNIEGTPTLPVILWHFPELNTTGKRKQKLVLYHHLLENKRK